MKKRYTILTLVIISFSNSSYAQSPVITTIAGNGTTGFSGDGGAATSAELNSVVAVAADCSGNVYIVDNQNDRIRKVSNTGIISTFAGKSTHGYSGDGGPATSAEIYNPYGVAVDRFGNVYIAEHGNNCIRKVNTAGIISTFAGNGTPGYSGDGGSATAANLDYPSGVAVDGIRNVYIIDNYRIRKVDTTGIISTFAGNGTKGFSGDGGPATSAMLGDVRGIAVDGSGNVYIGDVGNNVIRKVNTNGIISTFAGNGTAGYSGDGGAAVSAELFDPYGVAVDGFGNVYIADVANDVIRKVSTTGIISTFAGNGTSGFSGDGGPANMATLNGVEGVAVDGAGNVYITQNNNVVRKVTVAAQPPCTATISSNGIGCESIDVVFTASNGIPPYSFTYQLNEGIPSTIISNDLSATANLSLQNVALGTYTCSLISVKDANPCSSPITITNQSVVINVYPKPNALFTVNPQQTNILIPSIAIVDASIGAYSWAWNFGDGATSFSPNPIHHTYTDTGTYTIKLVVGTSAGCTDSTYQTVTITTFFTLYIPTAFTPNEDKVNDIFMPKGEGILKYELNIYDRWGNMIFYSNDINKGWDGLISNHLAQMDTYVFVLHLTALSNKHDFTYNGKFDLIK